MATKKKLTINEMCEMEARRETCPELEKAHKQMASAFENFRTVGLPDFMRHDELLRNIGLDPKLDQLNKAILDTPVMKLSRELETMNLGVSSSLKHLIDAMNVSGIAGLRNTLTEIDSRHATEMEKIREEYFGGSHHRSAVESLLKDARDNPQAHGTFSNARFMPMVDPRTVFPDVEVNPIQQGMFDATREQNESMRENFALLIGQMKTQTTNSEKLLQISIAATEGNIASKKRNDRQFIVMVVLSFLMAWGSLPTIINTVTHILHWLKIR
jgi:hypothetical protein